MRVLTSEESNQIAQLRAQGYRFERRAGRVVIKNNDGSVVGNVGDVREWLATLDATGWPWGYLSGD